MSAELEQRVARLERENRHLKYLVLVALLVLLPVLGVLFLARRSNAKVGIQASSFEVVDGKGRTRATLGLTDKDEPFLSLTGSDNSKHVLISIRPEGSPFMVMGDVNAPQHLSLYGPTPQHEGGIDLTRDGKHIAELRVSQDGIPSFILRDKEEKVLWKAP